MDRSLAAEFDAIRERSGFLLLPYRALLQVTGSDSARWLNGMVTNSISTLQPGEGAYSFALNAQGRIQGDCIVYREPCATEPASFLLSTTAAQADALQPWLDRYIIMDDVELLRSGAGEQTLLLMGPASAAHLQTVGLPLPEPLRLLRAGASAGEVLLMTPSAGLVPRVEVRAPGAVIATLQEQLIDAGSLEISSSTVEAWRVLEGVPLFGVDIRDRDLPQETGQTDALHFNKGCYLGQEIVERIRSRGQVHRTLTRFALSGKLPAALPAALEADGKPAGELTSVAEIPSPEGTRLLALGYARREMLAGAAPLHYAGGTAAAAK